MPMMNVRNMSNCIIRQMILLTYSSQTSSSFEVDQQEIIEQIKLQEQLRNDIQDNHKIDQRE